MTPEQIDRLRAENNDLRARLALRDREVLECKQTLESVTAAGLQMEKAANEAGVQLAAATERAEKLLRRYNEADEDRRNYGDEILEQRARITALEAELKAAQEALAEVAGYLQDQIPYGYNGGRILAKHANSIDAARQSQEGGAK